MAPNRGKKKAKMSERIAIVFVFMGCAGLVISSFHTAQGALGHYF